MWPPGGIETGLVSWLGVMAGWMLSFSLTLTCGSTQGARPVPGPGPGPSPSPSPRRGQPLGGLPWLLPHRRYYSIEFGMRSYGKAIGATGADTALHGLPLKCKKDIFNL